MLLAPGSLRSAEIELAPGATPCVFGGGLREVPVEFRNRSDQTLSRKLSYRLLQISSGSLMPLGAVSDWKSLAIGPGQGVTDVVRLELPSVRVPTRFQLAWTEGGRRLGTLALQVVPEQLLGSLNGPAEEPALGLIDPSGCFTNALRGVRLELLAEAESIAAFPGRLILVAPVSAGDRVAGLAKALKRRAAAGTGVVWVQPARAAASDVVPSAYVIEEGEGRLVIAEEELVRDLAGSASAQLHLLRLTDLATGRRKLQVPEESSSELLTRQE